jgi:hypothetical protein
VVTADGFYDLSSPDFPQQGDIFPNIPMVSPPPSSSLIILRDLNGGPWDPRPGPLLASSEDLLNAFDAAPEYVAASAERGLAMILTQTCDLVDEGWWLAGHVRDIADAGIDAGNLFAGKYSNLFGLPKHPLGHFEAGVVELTRPFPVPNQCFQQKDRVASLTLGAQHALSDKISESLTRPWGYAPGDSIPKSGRYRCLRCFLFDGLKNEVVALLAGEKFPECQDCQKIKKRAQWRPLRKHDKY